MNITISMSESEMESVIEQSVTFRSVVAREFANLQSKLANAQPTGELELINSLKSYVRDNFNYNSKIVGIKYVRQWAKDNQPKLSFANYDTLYSLSGAKTFVESNIKW